MKKKNCWETLQSNKKAIKQTNTTSYINSRGEKIIRFSNQNIRLLGDKFQISHEI